MNWKEKLKWKLITILIALLGIFIVWCAEKTGGKRSSAEAEILRRGMIKENEWASAQALPVITEACTETVKKPDPYIRVLLMTDGYDSYYHEKVSLRFQGDYELQEGENRVVSNGEMMDIYPQTSFPADRKLVFVPAEPDNKIQILSLNRGQGNPVYKGKISVLQDERGLRIINELPLEDYLCGVVPSEMPASYPMEALKAQAVCARTYACVQMQGSKLEKLGAQVDDSVSFQVYQNSPEADSAKEAVRDTQGQVLLNNGVPIHAYYFSTSHGRTSTDEVWEASVPAAYLKSVACSYDASQPWYQWSVILPKEKLLQNVRKKFSDVNAVETLEIRETGEGEAVLNLVVHTDKGEKELHSEYEIRSLLAPLGQSITRQDGSMAKGGSLLPSAYFTAEEIRDENKNLTGYRILGGGYGHGVGMSQNGAKGMADMGKSCEEILTYFYKDIIIGNIKDVVNYEDS